MKLLYNTHYVSQFISRNFHENSYIVIAGRVGGFSVHNIIDDDTLQLLSCLSFIDQQVSYIKILRIFSVFSYFF